MEVLRGIKIRDIFLDNQNWWNFYLKFSNLIRESIVINICKILIFNTKYLGFHQYVCPKCDKTKKVFHTCKSRFCSSCGKKDTEQWIERNLSVLPQVPWQHITFTLPQELRKLYKKEQLILLPELKHIQNYTDFNKWLHFLYQKSWGSFTKNLE